MSFAPVSDVPAITWADLRRLERLTKSQHGGEREPDRMTARPLQSARAYHRKVLDRYLLGVLKPAPFAVLSAITARTFGFNKALEAIPLKTFRDGMPGVDEDGLPYFGGINLATSTIRLALDELAEEHLIERYQIIDADRPVHAYMPVSFLVFMHMVCTTIDIDQIPDSISGGASLDRDFSKHESRILAPMLRKTGFEQAEAA